MPLTSDDDAVDVLNQAILASDSQDESDESLSPSALNLNDSVVVINDSIDDDENRINTEQKTPPKNSFQKIGGWRSVASTTKKKKVWTDLCYLSSDDDTSDNRSKARKKIDVSNDHEATSGGYNTNADSEDDEFENFLTKYKTPKRVQKSPQNEYHDGSFIAISSDEENDEQEFYISLRKTPLKKPDKITNFKTPKKLEPISYKKGSMTEPRRKLTNNSKEKRDFESALQPRLSFLSSLNSDVDINKCDPGAVIYRKSFKNHKDELAQKLFSLFNSEIFNDQLPHDMEITWNARMRKTAGFCRCRRNPVTAVRIATIELAPKVLDNADRLRDTLVHELCHAAAWVIDGVHDGHGYIWKEWTRRARYAFPELPPIDRCHSYAIHTKFIYKCSQCFYKIGRHSKSVDTTKKCCPYCKSKLELHKNTKTNQDDDVALLNSNFANKLSLN